MTNHGSNFYQRHRADTPAIQRSGRPVIRLYRGSVAISGHPSQAPFDAQSDPTIVARRRPSGKYITTMSTTGRRMVLHPVLYFAHISMGVIGLLSGAAALSFRKGSRRHRIAGNVFFPSMLIMSAIGAYGSLYVPEMISVVVGVLTFYLVATSWMTVMRKEREIGVFEYGAIPVALAIAAAGFTFGLEAANSKTGLKDGFPAEPHFFFAAVALIAAALDIRMVVRGGVYGAQRIARHLWRMCFALFIAAASLFLGQPQVFPEAVRGTFILAAPVVMVILLMVYWLIRVLFTSWYRAVRP